MARQRVAVQVNQFVGGLNTESNPLSAAPDTTRDEQNMTLLSDGSRRRRLGFDVEENYNSATTFAELLPNTLYARQQFTWPNPGGVSGKEFVVVQIGDYIGVHDMDESPVSSTPLFSKRFTDVDVSQLFGLAVVDGTLVVATGEGSILSFSYNGTTVEEAEDRLLIRDFFGVEAVADSRDLNSAKNLQYRPKTLKNAHLYNLRNQTFAMPRVQGGSDTINKIDPVRSFYNLTGQKRYPSNADSVIPHLFANANLATNRTVERLNPEDMVQTSPGTSKAPQGFFIIDALKRGSSRLEREADLRSEYSDLNVSVSDLPKDKTPKGASVLAQYAARVWYAGFSAKVIDGDKLSPRMASYVLFSQVVNSPDQIVNCFQEADPTSNIDPNIVDTDGGFIKLDGAYNIKAMKVLQSSLFVFAENGVWRINGEDENGFRATSYTVSKVSEEGCISPGSVVVADNTLLYWGERGIYAVAQQQTGDWASSDITKATIQTFYNDISEEDKFTCTSYYDTFNDSIRWLYGNNLDGETDSRELLLNVKFNAFTFNKILSTDTFRGPISLSGGLIDVTSGLESVTASSEVVVDENDIIVTSRNDSTSRGNREVFYTVVIFVTGGIDYTFGSYRNEDPTDWLSVEGVDTPAFLVTAPVTGGDARLRKEVPYLTTYFSQTEQEGLGSVASSCIMRAQWDWTSDPATSRWSDAREIYRPARTSVGHDFVVTKNRIRGRGRVVTLRFESSPNKAMRLYGWEHNLDSTTEE